MTGRCLIRCLSSRAVCRARDWQYIARRLCDLSRVERCARATDKTDSGTGPVSRGRRRAAAPETSARTRREISGSHATPRGRRGDSRSNRFPASHTRWHQDGRERDTKRRGHEPRRSLVVANADEPVCHRVRNRRSRGEQQEPAGEDRACGATAYRQAPGERLRPQRISTAADLLWTSFRVNAVARSTSASRRSGGIATVMTPRLRKMRT